MLLVRNCKRCGNLPSLVCLDTTHDVYAAHCNLCDIWGERSFDDPARDKATRLWNREQGLEGRACEPRKYFPSQLNAEVAARAIMQKPGAERQYVAPCDQCGGWHLTKGP